MTERDQFGPFLRRERERRGISLQDIADRTKIAASLFAALERNDFSRWPGGIYRRSFVRAYAEAIGVDADRAVCDAVRLFPADEEGSRGPVVASTRAGAPPPRTLRLVASRPAPGQAHASAGHSLTTVSAELAAVAFTSTGIGIATDWLYGAVALSVGVLLVGGAQLRLRRARRSAPADVPRTASTVVPARRLTRALSLEHATLSQTAPEP